jgi:hypothetical protein
MGQFDASFGTDTYETRELAWELSQEHTDNDRIKFLMDTGADLRIALQIANIPVQQLTKNPGLKSLQLHKRLEAVN